MSITKPFYRNWRQFVDGHYFEGGRWQYVLHPKYAKSREQYVRAFLLIQKDLQNLFDYIEPSDGNLNCYSFRVHELLMRSCIEVEANFKAILLENGYEKKDKKGEAVAWNIGDYKKIEKTHRLSSYKVKIPHWYGKESVRTPFLSWAQSDMPSPTWFKAYNSSKHNRHEEFHQASFGNLIDSICGLLVLLSAQFGTQDFSPGDSLLAVSGPKDGMESAIGDYFRIKFPDDWPLEDRYEFNWLKLSQEENPFQKIDFSGTTHE